MSVATLEAPTLLDLPTFTPSDCCERPSRREPSVGQTADRDARLNRLRRVICVRRSVRADTYENDLKLSIALDRLMDVLERG